MARLHSISISLGFLLAGLLLTLAVLPARAAPGQSYNVSAEQAGLYQAPASDAPVIDWLQSGDRVIEYEARGPWLRVAVFGGQRREGWIEQAALNRTTIDPAPNLYPEPPPPIEPTTQSYFTLEVSGSPAHEYIGHCRLIDFDGTKRRIELKNFIPKTYIFEVAALRCTVQQWDVRGRLIATIRDPNRNIIARRGTAARFNYVRVFSDGPWGVAGSVRGAIPTVVINNRDKPKPTQPINPSAPTGVRAGAVR